MRKLISIASLIILLAIVHVSCSKDDNTPPAAKTKTDLITKASWKFESASSSLLGDISTNPLLACYVDNVMTFSTNLSGTIVEGTIVCSTPAPANFTWSFLNNESTLHLSFTLFTGGSPDFTIVSLSETNLVLSQKVTIAPYPEMTIVATFKH
ncbi:MAG: lipocalin family protein [Chitinophagaceae bacterium]